jgi:hypothetical protein
MARQDETALGLVPLTSPPSLRTAGIQEALGVGHAVTKRELQIADQWHEQTLVIDADASKSIFGIEKLTEIQQHAACGFVETAAYIDRHRREAQGTAYQAPVDEFSHYLMQVAARQILAAVEVSGAGIGAEINRSLYPPPEPVPPPKRGWLQRLLGG